MLRETAFCLPCSQSYDEAIGSSSIVHFFQLFFVIQIKDIASVAPNDATQPDFGSALRDAAAHGVRVLAYDCDVAPDCLTIRREVPVIL